jgi:hypothetical protein
LAGIRHANRMLAHKVDWESTDTRLRRLLLEPAYKAMAAVGQGAADVRRVRRPQSACLESALRPEWRRNGSARSECAYAVAKRWARADVQLWYEQYQALECMAGTTKRCGAKKVGKQASCGHDIDPKRLRNGSKFATRIGEQRAASQRQSTPREKHDRGVLDD